MSAFKKDMAMKNMVIGTSFNPGRVVKPAP
jgi:hypothetical protein